MRELRRGRLDGVAVPVAGNLVRRERVSPDRASRSVRDAVRAARRPDRPGTAPQRDAPAEVRQVERRGAVASTPCCADDGEQHGVGRPADCAAVAFQEAAWDGGPSEVYYRSYEDRYGKCYDLKPT